MEQTPQVYRKLPGARRTPLRKATLWIAGDHILSIDSHRFSEEYKRYYFKDIQAIIVTTGSTAMGKAMGLIVAILLALLALSAWRNNDMTAMRKWSEMMLADPETPAGARGQVQMLMALSDADKKS